MDPSNNVANLYLSSFAVVVIFKFIHIESNKYFNI